jgi:predicted nucleic acid-binding protein
MENKIIVLDTDFFWEYITGNVEAITFLTSDNYDIISISAITVAELIKGCGNKIKLAKLNRQIKSFLPLHIDTAISSVAIELIQNFHLSHNISINDAYIAATCLHFDIQLATCNTSDYHYIPNLVLAKHDVKPKRKGWDFFL